MLKHFVVYLEYNEDVTKVHVPAKNKQDAIKFVAGNGEIAMIKEGERTPSCPISLGAINQALRNNGFGEMEIQLIERTLYRSCNFVG